MSKRIQLRRGTTAETSTFTGAAGEVTVDTTKKTLVVHDGVTAGGHPLMKEMAFGIGNERLDVTSSRTGGVTYTNTTGNPKMVNVIINLTSAGSSAALFEGTLGIDTVSTPTSAAQSLTLSGIILPNRTYRVVLQTGTGNIQKWIEAI